MLIEAQNIADALAKVLAAAIIDYEANVGCDGIPVQDYGFITDAAWDEEGDEVKLTIQPGDRTWVIRPQEVAEVPPTAGRHSFENQDPAFLARPVGFTLTVAARRAQPNG